MIKIDIYTKVVLTIIAVSLSIIAFRSFIPEKAMAEKEIVDVNIVKVGGWNVNSSFVPPLRVKIAK